MEPLLGESCLSVGMNWMSATCMMMKPKSGVMDQTGWRRFLPYGIDMDENTHWVVLGDVATTEIFDGESFSGSVAFPKSFRGTCVGNLGDGKAIVALGDFWTFFPYEVNLTKKGNQSLSVCRL